MPNRASELAWDDDPSSSTRSGLTRARVVEAAIGIADAEGIDAVSIRRVAAALDVRPMSLYSHIASKDDLVSLMLDTMSEAMLVPEPLPDDWREALRVILRRTYDVYLDHPWMLNVLSKPRRVGPSMLRRAEQSATAVRVLDLAPADSWLVLSLVHEWTMGHALHVVTLRDDDQLRDQLRDSDPESFPEMSNVFGDEESRPSEVNFYLSLETVLDGVAYRFLQG